jgi:hypothetical protein
MNNVSKDISRWTYGQGWQNIPWRTPIWNNISEIIATHRNLYYLHKSSEVKENFKDRL